MPASAVVQFDQLVKDYPTGILGRQKLRNKLRVFADAKHTHAAQQPKVLELNKMSDK